MKRVIVFLCLLLTLTLPVCAATQQVTFSEFDGVEMLKTEGAATAFEVPMLQAGERLATPDVITLTNNTDEEKRIVLDYVELPFDNEQSLAYLDYITVTVRQGENVLFDAPYTCINDQEGGLKLDYLLAAGESVVLLVDLKASFRLEEKTAGLAEGERIAWKFANVVQTPAEGAENVTEAFSNTSLRDVLVIAAAAALLLAIVAINEVVNRRRGRRW